jgi:hypothetical protein
MLGRQYFVYYIFVVPATFFTTALPYCLHSSLSFDLKTTNFFLIWSAFILMLMLYFYLNVIFFHPSSIFDLSVAFRKPPKLP